MSLFRSLGWPYTNLYVSPCERCCIEIIIKIVLFVLISEMLKRANGNYTEKQILRCTQMSGTFGRQLDRVFTKSGLGAMETRRDKVREKAFQKDLSLFVEECGRRNLCCYKPGRRAHKGFADIGVDAHITNPIAMGQKMVYLSTRMDNWRRLRIPDDPQ